MAMSGLFMAEEVNPPILLQTMLQRARQSGTVCGGRAAVGKSLCSVPVVNFCVCPVAERVLVYLCADNTPCAAKSVIVMITAFQIFLCGFHCRGERSSGDLTCLLTLKFAEDSWNFS